MGQLTASYDAGTAAAPLVGDTIGVALQKMVVAQPDVEALVSRHQGVRLSYGELGTEVERVARPARRRHREGRPGRHLVADLRRVDAAAVRVRPCRSDPRQREPGVPAERARVRAPPVGRAGAGDRPRFKTSDYLDDDRRRAGRAPRARAGRDDRRRSSRRRRRPALSTSSSLAGDGTSTSTALREREAELDPDDPINIQYTSGTTGNPKGATLTHHNILNNARSIAAGARLHRADRVCIPVPLYHCFGMGLGTLGCVASGAAMVYPRRVVRRRSRRSRRSPRSAARASTACRRCSSRSSSHPGSRDFDLIEPAHRDHGRRAVPDRGDEAGRRARCTPRR